MRTRKRAIATALLLSILTTYGLGKNVEQGIGDTENVPISKAAVVSYEQSKNTTNANTPMAVNGVTTAVINYTHKWGTSTTVGTTGIAKNTTKVEETTTVMESTTVEEKSTIVETETTAETTADFEMTAVEESTIAVEETTIAVEESTIAEEETTIMTEDSISEEELSTEKEPTEEVEYLETMDSTEEIENEQNDVYIYSDMNINSTTGMSKDQFIQRMNNLNCDYTGYFSRNAGLIWELCQQYQINEIAFCGIIGLESGWAQYGYSYNYFGIIGAEYQSEEEGLCAFAELLGNSYLHESGVHYSGATLLAVSQNYCEGNPTWPSKVYDCMLCLV